MSDTTTSDPTRPTDPVRGFLLLGLMLGAAVGAAIGLLYAPRPGSESRRGVAHWAEDMGGRLTPGGQTAPDAGPSADGGGMGQGEARL
jgi:hypothetical protein